MANKFPFLKPSDESEDELYSQEMPMSEDSGENEEALLPEDLLNQEIEASEQTFEPPSLEQLPAISGENDLSARRAKLLEQYRNIQPQNFEDQLTKAQDERRKQLALLTMLRGASQIGQGMASSYGGKVGDNADAIGMLEKQAGLPVEEIGEQQKASQEKRKALGDELGLSQKVMMQDPQSRVSQLYRKVAQSKGLEVSDDMAASDIEDLMKQTSKGKTQARYYPTTVLGADGKPEVVFVNTADPTDIQRPGLNRAYAPRMIKDPRTGEYIEVMPGAEGKKKLTGPETPEQKEAGKEEVKLNRYTLDSEQGKRLDKTREDFMKDTSDDRTAIGAAQGVKSMLSAGKEVKGDILRAIQNQLARASGERGAMTENDVAPFGGRAALTDKLSRFASMQSVGQIPESDRKFLSQVADIMEKRARGYVDTRSKFFVDNFYNDLKDSPNLKKFKFDKNEARKLIGVDSVVNPQDKVKVMKPDGSVGFIPVENLEKALKSGYKEIK